MVAHLPTTMLDNDTLISELAKDQINTGTLVATANVNAF